MTRLDRHVAVVRTKMTTDQFLRWLAWTLLAFGAGVWVMILVDRVFHWRPPHWTAWFFGGAGVAALVAFIISYVRRPTAAVAAVAIDEKLGLKEKFSTALFVRNLTDPFAQAAVKDAEQTAQGVNLHAQFPLRFPRVAYWTVTVAILAGLTGMFLDPLDVIAKPTSTQKPLSDAKKIEDARRQLKDALAIVEAVPKAVAQQEQVKIAHDALVAELKKGDTIDPASANREAIKRLQDVQDAMKETVKGNQRYAEAKSQEKMFKSLQGQAMDEPGPVNDARKALAQGNFEQAINELNKTVENFDKMDKKEQEKAAQQMQKMAQQLQQMANDPDQQKKMQEEMQKMGMNQQQAQQAQQLMQQAAQGDKQAQQQLQQMAQQAQQQMNNGQGPTPQQKQAMQQMMQQMQGMTNAQQQAQQMGQQAQQMQQAMQQQAAQQKGQQQGQQQQGQQQGQQQQQQMQQNMQNMQNAMQQMQAMQADAAQMQAAQKAAAQGQQAAMNNMNGENAPGGNPNGNGGQGQWDPAGQIKGNGQQNKPFDGQAQFAGPNQGGQGAGDRTYKNASPYGTKTEMDPSENIEKGRVIASSLVKSDALKGEAKEALKEVIQAAEKQAPDEVDQDRVSRQAQRVVRDYFSSMQKDADAGATPAPTPAPDAATPAPPK